MYVSYKAHFNIFMISMYLFSCERFQLTDAKDKKHKLKSYMLFLLKPPNTFASSRVQEEL